MRHNAKNDQRGEAQAAKDLSDLPVELKQTFEEIASELQKGREDVSQFDMGSTWRAVKIGVLTLEAKERDGEIFPEAKIKLENFALQMQILRLEQLIEVGGTLAQTYGELAPEESQRLVEIGEVLKDFLRIEKRNGSDVFSYAFRALGKDSELAKQFDQLVEDSRAIGTVFIESADSTSQLSAEVRAALLLNDWDSDDFAAVFQHSEKVARQEVESGSFEFAGRLVEHLRKNILEYDIEKRVSGIVDGAVDKDLAALLPEGVTPQMADSVTETCNYVSKAIRRHEFELELEHLREIHTELPRAAFEKLSFRLRDQTSAGTAFAKPEEIEEMKDLRDKAYLLALQNGIETLENAKSRGIDAINDDTPWYPLNDMLSFGPGKEMEGIVYEPLEKNRAEVEAEIERARAIQKDFVESSNEIFGTYLGLLERDQAKFKVGEVSHALETLNRIRTWGRRFLAPEHLERASRLEDDLKSKVLED